MHIDTINIRKRTLVHEKYKKRKDTLLVHNFHQCH